jgi:RNA polymerase sigma-70 factor, ECF subfamily
MTDACAATAIGRRLARARGREVLDEDALEQAEHPMSNPEELADQKRARQLLDEALDAMDLDLRAVFVLFELEELTAPEIAALLELPVGTVSSRLRRAREEFRAIVARIRRRRSGGDWPAHAVDNPRGGGR